MIPFKWTHEKNINDKLYMLKYLVFWNKYQDILDSIAQKKESSLYILTIKKERRVKNSTVEKVYVTVHS